MAFRGLEGYRSDSVTWKKRDVVGFFLTNGFLAHGGFLLGAGSPSRLFIDLALSPPSGGKKRGGSLKPKAQ